MGEVRAPAGEIVSIKSCTFLVYHLLCKTLTGVRLLKCRLSYFKLLHVVGALGTGTGSCVEAYHDK